MSTGTILGVVGAGIGFFFGGPMGAQIGFLAGSLIGSIIDPPKVQGPRIGDLKLTRSAYGGMIPYVWGQGRIGTNVIDQTDLIEHSETSSGKGGPQVTNFTYSASWLAALCMRLPNRNAAIIGITHLYLDGRLYWSTEGGGECPCRVYIGTEDQDPDATFEAIHGAGLQPAYRGVAYLSFTDFSLTDFGNRIPNVEAVVVTKAGDFPWRVSSFTPWPVGSAPGSSRVGFNATFSDGLVTTSFTERAAGVVSFYVNQFQTDGTPVGSEVVTTLDFNSQAFLQVRNSHRQLINGPGPTDYVWYDINLNPSSPSYLQFAVVSSAMDPVSMAAYPYRIGGNENIIQDGMLYSADSNGVNAVVTLSNATLVTAGGGELAVFSYTLDDNYAASNIGLGSSNDGHFYAMVRASGGGTKVWKLDDELNLVTFWDTADTASTDLDTAVIKNFHVYNGMLVFEEGGAPKHIQVVQTGATLTDVGVALTHNTSFLIDLGGGLGLDQDGVYSLNAPADVEILSDIVDDLASLTPLAAYDNSEGVDEVRWFALGSQQTVRNALEKLRQAFFFDVVEEDDSVNLRKRGDRTVVTIPDDDLLARGDGEEPGDPLRTIRRREQELPRTITMTYIDVDLDWNTGAQSSPRQVTQSEYDVTLEVPIGLTSAEAAQKAWAIQCAEWTERESFEWQLPRWWAKVTPATLLDVRGRIIRVRQVSESRDTGVLTMEGVVAAPSVYTQVTPGSGGEGAGTGSPGGGTGGGGGGGGGGGVAPPGGGGGTTNRYTFSLGYLLDLPILSQGDAPFGFYWVVCPANFHMVLDAAGKPLWPGASLYKSLDGGTTWVACASTTAKGVIGNSFSTAPYTGQLPDYAGSSTVTEEVSILVYVTQSTDTLTSVTEAALDNGANLCAISRTGPGGSGYTPGVSHKDEYEIVQFRDAVQVDTYGWVLTGFRRGKYGTLSTAHTTNDAFVMLDHRVNVSAPESELNVELPYRVITSGDPIDSWLSALYFTNSGSSAGGSNSGGSGGTPPVSGGTNPGVGYFDNIAANFPFNVRVVTGTSDTLASTDRATLVTYSNAATCTVTLPTTLPSKWWCLIQNRGAGDVDLNPAGSANLDGVGTTLTVAADQGLILVFDGTNYWTSRGMGGGSSGLADGDYGDIVVSGGGTVFTIDSLVVTSGKIADDAVTNAKLANMASGTIKGRRTAGTSDPEDISLANLKTDLGLTGTNSGDQTITLTGNVTGTGTGSFSATIANSAVTNAKLADMTAHTFKARNTNSTGAPEDATATQATALLDAMVGDTGTGGTKGLVPVPAAGTAAASKYLKADGTWAIPAGTGAPAAGSATRWDWVFNGGTDASATCDGSTAVAGMTLAGSVYTLTRSVAFVNLTINSGITVKINNAGNIFVSGTLTGVDATSIISADGASANNGTAGSGISANFFGTGSSGGSIGNSGAALSPLGLGGVGGTGGAAVGGPGTGGGARVGGVITPPAVSVGGPQYAALLNAWLTGRDASGGNRWQGGSGGGSGDGASAGAGGAGGHPFGVFARNVAGTLKITSKGGLGGNGTTAGNMGGGAGGGGGVGCFATQTTTYASVVTFDVTGGAGGAPTGTGKTGATGSNGTGPYIFVLD